MSPARSVRLSQYSKAMLRLIAVMGFVLGISGKSSQPAHAQDGATGGSPQVNTAVPPSLFGVQMYHVTSSYGLSQMSAAGAYWVRSEGVLWSEVQPVEGQVPDWNALADLDVELANAQAEGMQVIIVVRSTPDWAQAIPGKLCGPIAQVKLAAFGDFLFQLVDRYKDRVTYWELWNEPDVDPDLVPANSPLGCWGDEDDEFYGGGYYADMLKVVYPRIKQADPNAQVLLGGLLLDCDPLIYCPNERSAKFLTGVLQNDGGSYFDGVSYHAFDYYLGEKGKYFNEQWQSSWDTTGPVGIAKAKYLRSVLAAAGYPNKYLLNTETSVLCSSGCDAVFETTKASYVAQSFSSAFDTGVRANIWFASLSGFNNADLLNSDLTPKPAYHAYQFAQSKLHAAEYIGKLGSYPGISGYEFRRADCPNTGEFCRLWVLWSLDGLAHTIELPEVPYSVYGVDGTPMPASLTITATLDPQYVELPPEFRVRMPVTVREYRILQNGDFEAGLDGWVASSGGQEGLEYSLVSSNPTKPILDTEIPIGSYSMLLGKTGYPCSVSGVPLGNASVEQTFSVPNHPNGSQLTLDFSYVIYTQDGNASSQYDRFEVYIDDGSGPMLVYWDGRLDTTVSCSNWYRIPNTGWKQASIDLILPVDYRGKVIKVSFNNWNRFDHWFNTFTYLDEVKLNTGP